MTPQEAQTYLRPTVVIFYAMLAGQVGFMMVAYYLVYEGGGVLGPSAQQLQGVLQYIVPALALVDAAIALLLYQVRIKAIRQQRTLAAKLRGYQGAVVLRSGMLNGGAFFLILSFLMTGLVYYLLPYAALLLVFILWRPNLMSAANDLQLSGDERRALEL